ncbi:capsid maturation protease [Felid alphaherpesvirus 1]|nr:capsid maturation protease [Felid alphaherpesvirus 1]
MDTHDIIEDTTSDLHIYVAGYLALYDMGDGGELTLTRDVVRAALPPASPLQINIDHNRKCVIGSVLSIVDDPKGPFFIGLLNCPQLGVVLASAASPGFFGVKEGKLTRVEQLLYLVSNYLPSASLSSRRLSPDEDPDDTLFAHVALCAIGRRVGTIVTYDVTPEAVIAPFRHLTPESTRELLVRARETEVNLDGRRWCLTEQALTRALLSTAVNSMLLKDRWDLVAKRRKEAGISGHLYLQASTRVGISNFIRDVFNGVESDGNTAYKQGKTGEPACDSAHTSLDVPSVPNAESATEKYSNTPEMASQGNSTISHPQPPNTGDYILVPTAQYNQLVVNQHQAANVPIQYPPASTFPPNIFPSTAIYHPPLPPNHFHPYGFTPSSSGLEAQISALLGALTSDRRISQRMEPMDSGYTQALATSPSQERRYARKRRHDWDSSGQRDEYDHQCYYPGESPPQQTQRSGTNNAIIAELAGVVSSLQQENTQLRALRSIGVYQQPRQDLHPNNQNQQYPSGALQPCVGTPPVCVSQPPTNINSQNVPITSNIQTNDITPKIDVAIAGTNHSQNIAATVDASTVTGLGVRDDTDFFVSQMMNAR